jgi:sterol desaturase/sphingolipid hydroxylase (fatty acid hydroxylase superfamily)
MLVRKRAALACVTALASLAAFVSWAIYWDEHHLAAEQLEPLLKAIDRCVAVCLAASGAVKMVAIILVVLALETFVVGWKRSSMARLLVDRGWSAILDGLFLTVALFNLSFFLEVVFSLGGSILLSRFLAWVSSHYQWTRLTLPSDGTSGIAFSLAIYWLTTSFVQYWGHRLMHTGLFWHLHRFHHAATELNMITAFRAHPLEPVVLRLLTLVSPLIFLNVPDIIFLLYFPVAVSADLLAHSQLKWDYGWFGRWVIQSPYVHQVHHSIDEEHQDLHFSTCPLWDHLFGTWYRGTKHPSHFGIADPCHALRPLTQLAWDAWIFYSSLGEWTAWLWRRLESGLPDLRRRPALRLASIEVALRGANQACLGLLIAWRPALRRPEPTRIQ